MKINSKSILLTTDSVSSDSVSEIPSFEKTRKKHVVLRLRDIKNHES